MLLREGFGLVGQFRGEGWARNSLYNTMGGRHDPLLVDQSSAAPVANFTRLRMVQSHRDLPRPFAPELVRFRSV